MTEAFIARDLEQRRGIGVLIVLALLAGGFVAYQNGMFTSDVSVEAQVDDIGGSLVVGNDVKLRGVIIGKVASIAARDDGVRRRLDGVRDTYGALTASSTGTVLASSPEAASSDEVTVTVFAEQHVLRGATGDEACVLSSIVWTMVRSGSDWLVDALEAPGAPVTVPC